MAGEPRAAARVDPEKWVRLNRLARAVDEMVLRTAMEVGSSRRAAAHYGLDHRTVIDVIANVRVPRNDDAARRTG